MKKNKPYLIGILIALAAEFLLFNYSALASIGNSEIDVSSKQTVTKMNSEYLVSINDVEEEVSNIYFDVALKEDAPVEYSIMLTDEGNFYDYPLPTGVISSGAPASFYTNIHPYGKLKSIDIRFKVEENASSDRDFTVNGIKLNVRRPFIFNPVRFLIVLGIICFFILLRTNGEAVKVELNANLKTSAGRKQLAIIAVCVLGLIGIGLFWSGSHKLLNEASIPHHQQYKELAKALSEGHTYVDDKPSEGLLEAPNPYDTIYLQANNIEYRADYAYYNERYYVYFGIVPELMLYYPSHAILGKDLPNYIAVGFYYALFVIGIFLLINKIISRYFKKASLVTYILLSTFVVTCPVFAYIYFTADIYSVPIMAALCLTAWGLYFWLRKSADRRKLIAEYAAGSLCMALVAGCRPQMLLFSFLAVPIFWNEVIKERTLFSRKSIGRTVGIVLPYILVAGVVMAYNKARFGSVFDFGATYSLTNNDMNLRGFSISRMVLGLLSFLFQPFTIDGVFPFLHSSEIGYSYMGKIVTEYFFGGVILCNILMWPVMLGGHFKKEIKASKTGLFVTVSLAVSLIIGLLDANQAGVLQRYTADMSFGLIIAAVIMLLILVEKQPKLGMNFLKIGLILELGYALLIMVNDTAGINLRMYNPDLFYGISDWFNW